MSRAQDNSSLSLMVMCNSEESLIRIGPDNYAYLRMMHYSGRLYAGPWSRGKRRIDWAGYTPEPKSEKEKGINRFKEKWGGQVIRYNVYDKIIASKRFMGLDWVKSQLRRFDIR